MEIFLVEDSEVVRERLAAMISELPGAHLQGYATQPRAAIRDILARKPDIVVLDAGFEHGSGFEVLREVHRREPGIDFYMLSNYPSESFRNYALRLGAQDYFDITSEIQRVRDTLAKRVASSM